MMMTTNVNPVDKDSLLEHIWALQMQLDDLKARLPAHSIPPAMIAELDHLDEQIAQAQVRLALLKGG